MCIVVLYMQMEFAAVHRKPPMKIPEGAGFTAYDYSENRSTPFAFRDAASNVLGLQADPPDIDVANPEAEEPLRGSLSLTAPVKALAKARKKLTWERYEPTRPFPRLGKLRELRELDDAKRVQTLKPSAGTQPDAVRSLELVGIQFDKSVLKALLSQVRFDWLFLSYPIFFCRIN